MMVDTQQLFSELEQLNHAERIKKVVLLGKRSRDDPDQSHLIDVLEQDFAFSGKNIALHSCYGSGDGERAVRLYKESTSPALRKHALKCLLNVGNDSQIAEVLSTLPLQTVKESFHKLHKSKRSAVIDSHLKACAQKGELAALKGLVFYASSDAIEGLWSQVERECEAKAWGFLANFHPAFTVRTLLASDPATLHERLQPALPWLCLHLPEDAWTCFQLVPPENRHRIYDLKPLIRLFPDRVLGLLLSIPDPKPTASVPPVSSAPALYNQLLRQHYFAWQLPTQPSLLKQVKKLSSEQRLKAVQDGIVPLSALLPRLSQQGRADLFEAWVTWWKAQEESLNILTADENQPGAMPAQAAAIRLSLSSAAFKPWLETDTPWLSPNNQQQLLDLTFKNAPKFFFKLSEASQLNHLTAVEEEPRLALTLQHPKVRAAGIAASIAASLSPENQVVLYRKCVQDAAEKLRASYGTSILSADAAAAKMVQLTQHLRSRVREAEEFEIALGMDEPAALSPFEASIAGVTQNLAPGDRDDFALSMKVAMHHLSEEQRRELVLAFQQNPVTLAPDWTTAELTKAEQATLQSAAKRVRSFLTKEASAVTHASTDASEDKVVVPGNSPLLQGVIVSDWVEWWSDTYERVLLPLCSALTQVEAKTRVNFLIKLAGAAVSLAYGGWPGRITRLLWIGAGTANVAEKDLVKLLRTWLKDEDVLRSATVLVEGWALFKTIPSSTLGELSIESPIPFMRHPKLCGLLPEDRQLELVQLWAKRYKEMIAASGVLMEGATPQLRMEMEAKAKKMLSQDVMMRQGLEHLADAVKRELYLSGFGQFSWFAPWEDARTQATFLKHLPEPERTEYARALMLHDPLPTFPSFSHSSLKRPTCISSYPDSSGATTSSRAAVLWARTQHFGAFLPWNELMEQEALKEKMQSAVVSERQEAIKFLVTAVQLKSSHFGNFLKLLHQKRREQDPVRETWLDGLRQDLIPDKPDTMDETNQANQDWILTNLSGLELVIDDALAAKDLSTSSLGAIGYLLRGLLPLNPQWGIPVFARYVMSPSSSVLYHCDRSTNVVHRMADRLRILPPGPTKLGEEYVDDLLQVATIVVKAAGQQPGWTHTGLEVFEHCWGVVKAVSGGLNKRKRAHLLQGYSAWMLDGQRCEGWTVQKPKLLALLGEVVKMLESKHPGNISAVQTRLCRLVLKHAPKDFPTVWAALDGVLDDKARSHVLKYIQKQKKFEYLKLLLRKDTSNTLGAATAKEALGVMLTVHAKNPEIASLVSTLLSQDPTYILIPKVFAYVSHHLQGALTPLLSRTSFTTGLYLNLQTSPSSFWLNITPVYVHCWSGAQQAQLASTLVSLLKRGGLTLRDARGVMSWLTALPACPISAYLSLLQTDEDSLPDAIRELVLGSLVVNNSKEAREALVAACHTDQCSTAVGAITAMLTAERGWQDRAGFEAVMATLRTLPWARVAVLKEVIRFLGRVAREQPLALAELQALGDKADLHRSGQVLLCEQLKQYLDHEQVLAFFFRAAAAEDFQVASAAAVMPAKVVEGGVLADNVAKLYTALLESSSGRLRLAAMEAWANSTAQVPWRQGLPVVEILLRIANNRADGDQEEKTAAQTSADAWLRNAARIESNFSTPSSK